MIAKPEDHKDTQLLYRTKIGPVLSVRAFELDSMYGLDILIPSPRNNKLTAWITACLGYQFFLQAKRFPRYFKKRRREFGSWNLALNMRARTLNCLKKNKNPEVPERLSRGRRRMFLGKIREPHHQPNVTLVCEMAGEVAHQRQRSLLFLFFWQRRRCSHVTRRPCEGSRERASFPRSPVSSNPVRPCKASKKGFC